MTKLLILITVLSMNNAYSYDYGVHDKYGNKTHSIVQDKGNYFVVDKYGKRGDYIDPDGNIRNKNGTIKGYLKKEK